MNSTNGSSAKESQAVIVTSVNDDLKNNKKASFQEQPKSVKPYWRAPGEYKTTATTSGEAVHFSKHKLHIGIINQLFAEITSERIARLVGLMAHFVYWSLFGHINQLPLDDYHMK